MTTGVQVPSASRIDAPWVEIHLDQLGRNIQTMQRAVRPETSLVFVVKADAYGHGLVPVALRAAQAGVKWFGVAYVGEALQLREALPDVEILVLSGAMGADAGLLLERRITPVVVSIEQLEQLSDAATALNRRLPVHLKIDTGMGRLGFDWQDAHSLASRLSALGGVEVRGLCTHFASVEVRKPALAPEQVRRFLELAPVLAQAVGKPLMRHVSSSRAFLYHPDWDFEGVRPGIALYGYGATERGMRFRTEPFLEWKTRVVQAKNVPANFPVGYYSQYTTTAPTRLATIAVGYADGYSRALSNKGFVLIRGKRCAVVGRVSMNWISVDCGPDSDVQAGDEVVLIGRQGNEAIWADELAKLARTIPYEILTSIRPGIERRYVG